MNTHYLIVFFALLLSFNIKSDKNSSNGISSVDNNISIDKEIEYINVRNSYVEYFNSIEYSSITDKIYKQEEDSLNDLKNKLKDILKGSYIIDITKQGEINLETLFEGLGFGMLDGLTIKKDSLKIFCTTEELLNNYFIESQSFKLDNLTAENTEYILNSIFYSGARISNFNFYRFPTNSNFQAYGMLGTVAQDIGPILPNNLYIILISDNFVYSIEKELNKPIDEIAECKNFWDSINLEANRHLKIYLSSEPQDEKELDKFMHLQDSAWNRYCQCYQIEINETEQFQSIQKETERIIQYITQYKE